MESGAQVGKGDAAGSGQGDFDRRAGRESFEIIEDALDQVAVLAATMTFYIHHEDARVIEHGRSEFLHWLPAGHKAPSFLLRLQDFTANWRLIAVPF